MGFNGLNFQPFSYTTKGVDYMKKETHCAVLAKVKQLVQVDSVEMANNMLASGEWVLVNSYNNTVFTTKRPLYTLGGIE